MRTVVALCLALFTISASADEFRAVVVTDSESAALRAAKARADEAQLPGSCGPNCTFTLNSGTHADLKPIGDNWIER